MKMVKSLLLGSAAGLVAIAGAQAADLPVKAKPVQYVKICSLYGVGFYYIPGTDVCLKVGGWARFETGSGYAGSFTTEWYANNANNRDTVQWHTRVKGTATFDARSPTEYGTVRSYMALGISTNNQADNPIAPNYANRWFIQWAGFTMGHSTSFYDFYSVGGNQYGFVTAASDSGDGGWDVIGYTAQFGNGLSGTLSAEIPRRFGLRRGDNFQFGAVGAVSTNYEALNVPDVVANLRIDQAWGSAQIMGALHEVQASYYGGVEGTGHPGDTTGFAVGAGIKLNAPMIGHGDYFQAEVDYTDGASRYSNMTATQWDYVKYDGNNVGFGVNTDAVYGGSVAAGTASDLQLTTTWSVNAAYTHFWNPAWKTTLWGSYRATSFNDQANNMLCNTLNGLGNAGTAAVAVNGCDMNWDVYGLGLRTEWAVSHTFSMGLSVIYSNLESATNTNNLVNAGGSNGKPAGTYAISDQDNWAVRFRATRAFYP
jgi:hypothetical protein